MTQPKPAHRIARCHVSGVGMSLDSVKQLVHDDFLSVNQAITDACASDVELISEISQHLINSGGKRIRPLLSLLAAKACTQTDNPQVATFAAVIEFIHAATLLHDDVVDESSLRRGKSTANQQWGNQAAILVGDFLYSRSFQMMVSLQSMPIMKLMADTTNTIAAGEVMQLIDCHHQHTTEKQYFQVIQAKTAVLFSAACQGAGILCQQNEATEAALAAFGLHLGLAYQLTDDALDYVGNTQTLGKTQGDDFTEGKLTLPLIYTLANCASDDQAWLAAALQQPDAVDFQRVQGLIDSTGAIEYTYQLAQTHCQQAQQQLALLPQNVYAEALRDCLQFITARQN